jgi:polyhydroxyalkanoate synthesis regulator phasin
MSSGHSSEIAIAITGVVTSTTAWFLGGRQRAKADSTDTLTKGADQIVETSNKLLGRLDSMLEEERSHRAMCEKSLSEHKVMIDELNRKVKSLEGKI